MNSLSEIATTLRLAWGEPDVRNGVVFGTMVIVLAFAVGVIVGRASA